VEGRIGNALGLSPTEARLLFERARARLGRRAVSARAAAFTFATAPLIRSVLPVSIRRRAIRPLVYALIPGPPENLLYAGITAAPHPREA
jgi:hypothetical protein